MTEIIANSESGFPDPRKIIGKFVLLSFPDPLQSAAEAASNPTETSESEAGTPCRPASDFVVDTLALSRWMALALKFPVGYMTGRLNICEFYMVPGYDAVAINDFLVLLQRDYPFMRLRADTCSCFSVHSD